MDWHTLIELVGVAVLLVGGGRFAGKVESAVGRLEEAVGDMNKTLEKLPKIESDLANLDESFNHHVRVDHQSIRARVDSVAEVAARVDERTKDGE